MQSHLAGGLAENKTFSDVRSEVVVLHQLQANMMVQCASNLHWVLTRERTAHDIPDIRLSPSPHAGHVPTHTRRESWLLISEWI